MEIASCSKCEDALDTTGYPKWCKGCRAKYKRDYDKTKENLTFGEGISAMRELLVGEFDKLGSGSFSGYEIAQLISQAPGPMLD